MTVKLLLNTTVVRKSEENTYRDNQPQKFSRQRYIDTTTLTAKWQGRGHLLLGPQLLLQRDDVLHEVGVLAAVVGGRVAANKTE